MVGFVLIIEDDDIQRSRLCELVEGDGKAAEGVKSADRALEVLDLRAHEISAVITDVAMDGAIDGVDLATDIRERWPEIRLVVLSGVNANERADFPAGVRFLKKPWNADDVLDAIRDP